MEEEKWDGRAGKKKKEHERKIVEKEKMTITRCSQKTTEKNAKEKKKKEQENDWECEEEFAQCFLHVLGW